MAGGTDREGEGTGLSGRDRIAPGEGRPPLFLARDSYRRHRIMDAARLLPLFGTVLVLLPILWAGDHGTASGLVYLFLVWALLILVAALLAGHLAEPAAAGRLAAAAADEARADPGAAGDPRAPRAGGEDG